MDDLEGARRMGREGAQGLGLSVQEQGAYDQGRRERQRAMEGFAPQGGGNGGGGGIALFIMIAPALAAPGLLVMATWAYITQTLAWPWAAALVIAIAEVVGLLWLVAQFYKLVPAVFAAIITSVYLGVSYAVCGPLFFSTDMYWTIALGVGAGALGYLAGLGAENKWMSSRLITTVAGMAAGIAMIVVLTPMVRATGVPLWMAMAVRWAGVGLIAGVILHTVFWTKWSFFVAFALVAFMIWQMPGFIEDVASLALGIGPGSGI